MKLVCLSDTHGQHEDLRIPDGDVLIHAGDCTDGGTKRETIDFLEWFASHPHVNKIIVPGNHDFFFEKEALTEIIPEGIEILIDRAMNIGNLKFYGSPYIPAEGNWAFSKERGAEIRKHWERIPSNTDVLITHTPPYGILDEIRSGLKLGCEELTRILKVVQPSYHFFGHIHHAAGTVFLNKIHHFNLAVLDERFRIMHSPQIINIQK